MQALKLSGLASKVVAGLSATAIGNMSAAEFAAAIGENVGSLTINAIKSLTTADIAALSLSQIDGFTSAQKLAMSAAVAAAVDAAKASPSIVMTEATLAADGTLDYYDLLTILQDAATGGLTGSEFADLNTVAQMLNVGGGPNSSDYAQQIFNDVVLGNSANAHWTGGTTTHATLGALTATSSQTQVTELIGKWFLGTDLPTFQNLPGLQNLGGAYQTYTLPLYGSTGAPQMTDINQGNDGDCYFLAALATETQHNAAYIKNMIQANGNGTYSVRFEVGGHADYVTVNSQLPSFDASHYSNLSGTSMEFDGSATSLWAPLIEKAYAQLMEQTSTICYNAHANSYATIDGGDSNGLSTLTGQSISTTEISATTSTASVVSLLASVQTALASGNGAMVGTFDREINNDWVAGHMFAVKSVDAAAGTVTLFNPWGTGLAAYGQDAIFTATVADLKNEHVVLEYALGAPLT